MEKVATDSLFDYYEVVLNSPYKRICYYFELDDGKQKTLYYSDMFTNDLVNERADYYQFPFNRKEDVADIPEWLVDATIYNIFPDSFATSSRHISLYSCEKSFNGIPVYGKLGGTIRGITENLDYIKALGANCIYINPIFTAGEYHKYDLIDYFSIDPCFGTNEEFKQLVNTCHENDLRVIIDGVFNHCGWNFFAFNDVVEKGEKSKYVDWFYGLEFPVIKPEDPETYPGYECFGYERQMPKMNTSNPEVLRYFLDVCTYWIEKYDIDGWRLDVANEVNHAFWYEFQKAAKAIKPDCALIGEVWETASFWLDGSRFDSTMNYDFRKHCKAFFADTSIDAAEFDGRVTHMRIRYRKSMTYGQLNLLDSHDVSRFLSLCEGDVARYKLAVLFQMAFIGAPSVFYGDEQAIEGIEESDYRRPMQFSDDGELLKFYKEVIALRNCCLCLRRGEFRTVFAVKNSGLYVFERYLSDERILVALNVSVAEAKIANEWMTGEVLLSKGMDNGNLKKYGYMVVKRC
jgi:glycosidase